MRAELHARTARGRKGAAFAVAILVVALLSVGGIVALNAASYDVATTGAVRIAANASTVSETGLAVGRCEVCSTLDGLAVNMQQVRQQQGRAAEFVMRDSDLQARLSPATSFFEPPAAGRRDSFGYMSAVGPDVGFNVRVDRPRESGGVAGYTMRESAGSDSGTLCFRRYRVTSNATFAPPGASHAGTASSQYRAYVVAGPLECSM